MSKTPYPYSSAIVAKTLKDWQNVPFEKIAESNWPDSAWLTLTIKVEPHYAAKVPPYSLQYREWNESFLCVPEGFRKDLSSEDTEKLGEKLIKPYISWKKANDEKRQKAEQKKETREHLKKLKQFLA